MSPMQTPAAPPCWPQVQRTRGDFSACVCVCVCFKYMLHIGLLDPDDGRTWRAKFRPLWRRYSERQIAPDISTELLRAPHAPGQCVQGDTVSTLYKQPRGRWTWRVFKLWNVSHISFLCTESGIRIPDSCKEVVLKGCSKNWPPFRHIPFHKISNQYINCYIKYDPWFGKE